MRLSQAGHFHFPILCALPGVICKSNGNVWLNEQQT